MTPDELKRKFPNASAAFILRNSKDSSARLPASDTQPAQGVTLVRSRKRKAQGIRSTEGRATIRFTVYSMRPADWDGWDIKAVQDLLIRSRIIRGDDWHLLKGEVLSEKVCTKEEERTEIEIIEPPSRLGNDSRNQEIPINAAGEQGLPS